MCRDGFRDICRLCGQTVTCRDDSPEHEWRDCIPSVPRKPLRCSAITRSVGTATVDLTAD